MIFQTALLTSGSKRGPFSRFENFRAESSGHRRRDLFTRKLLRQSGCPKLELFTKCRLPDAKDICKSPTNLVRDLWLGTRPFDSVNSDLLLDGRRSESFQKRTPARNLIPFRN